MTENSINDKTLPFGKFFDYWSLSTINFEET